MSIDIDTLRARNDARRSGRTEAPPSPADVEELLTALDDVQQELRRLTRDRADLLASAELWADLYAANVDRANAAEAVVRRLTDVPADVQRYYALLDTIGVLRETVEGIVRDCAQCAMPAGPVSQRDREAACARCARAVDALRAALDWRSAPQAAGERAEHP
jgi:hypothetical protein